MPLPQSLLTHVYWSFAEPVPASAEALVVAAGEYAEHIGVPSPEARLRAGLPLADLRVRYSRWNRLADGPWKETSAEVRIVGVQGKLTGAEFERTSSRSLACFQPPLMSDARPYQRWSLRGLDGECWSHMQRHWQAATALPKSIGACLSPCRSEAP
jgi:hypothetical protein